MRYIYVNVNSFSKAFTYCINSVFVLLILANDFNWWFSLCMIFCFLKFKVIENERTVYACVGFWWEKFKGTPNLKTRIKAIACALWYSILPWGLYEKECHYKEMSYWAHLVLNLKYAYRWLLFMETTDDIAFEEKINGNLKKTTTKVYTLKPTYVELFKKVKDLRDELIRMPPSDPGYDEKAEAFRVASQELRAVAKESKTGKNFFFDVSKPNNHKKPPTKLSDIVSNNKGLSNSATIKTSSHESSLNVADAYLLDFLPFNPALLNFGPSNPTPDAPEFGGGSFGGAGAGGSWDNNTDNSSSDSSSCDYGSYDSGSGSSFD